MSKKALEKTLETRLEQAAVLFEVIATRANNLERVLVIRDETYDPESIVNSVESGIAQLGLLADHGTGLASGSDTPACKGAVEDWLLPPGYSRPVERAETGDAS